MSKLNFIPFNPHLCLGTSGLTVVRQCEEAGKLLVYPNIADTFCPCRPITGLSQRLDLCCSGTFPHLFHIAHGGRSEETFIFAGKVGSVTIAHTIACARCIETLAEHQAASLLEAQMLLILQRAHRGERPEVMVE